MIPNVWLLEIPTYRYIGMVIRRMRIANFTIIMAHTDYLGHLLVILRINLEARNMVGRMNCGILKK